MVLFAAVSTPQIVGIYSVLVILTTGLQSAFELPIRQYAVGLIESRLGMRWLRRYQLTYALIGAAAILGMVLLLFRTSPADVPPTQILVMGLMAIVPVLNAAGTAAVARLQMANRWRFLAGIQLVALACGMAVAVPALLWTHGSLGPVLLAVVSEAVTTVVVVFAAGRVASQIRTLSDPFIPSRPEYLAVVVTSLSVWIQGNLDRLLIAAFAGAAALGLYSFAWAVARSFTDASAAGLINLLRPRLITVAKDARSGVLSALARPAIPLVGLASLTIAIGAVIVIPLILSADWLPVLSVVPLISLVAMPAVYEALTQTYLIVDGRAKSLYVVRAVAIGLTIPVGLAAIVSLQLAAIVLFVRQIVTLVLTLRIARLRPEAGLLLRSGVVLLLQLSLALGAFLLYS